MEFFIKKLLHQELGYFRSNSDQPGTSRGQYFLISKNHLDFFPPLSKNISQDIQLLNLVTHDSVYPAQVKYIYDNDKYHGSTERHPRDEHRINLNKHVNPEKKIFLKDDIVIMKKESFINEERDNEEALVVTRFRKSLDGDDYDLAHKILKDKRISRISKNYCYARKSDLLEIRKFRERLFSDVLPKDKIIIPYAENIFDLESKDGFDLGKRLSQKTPDELKRWETQMRRIIFDKYNHMCSLTQIGFNWIEYNKKTEKMDLKLSFDKGVEGAHIKPRSHKGPYTQDNIIPLIAPVHRLFDRGIFTINDDSKITIHPEAKKQSRLSNFHIYDGKKLFIPKGITLSPDHLSWHRKKIYGIFTLGKQIRSL